ncbi:MAG: DUF2470 domain-containing protein [Pseudomonadota bacterium]
MNLTESELTRIIDHMNDDHADALVLYAHAYASRSDISQATMDGLTSDSIVLALPDGEKLAIPLIRQIETAHDAHMVLVDMAKEGRQRLNSGDST